MRIKKTRVSNGILTEFVDLYLYFFCSLINNNKIKFAINLNFKINFLFFFFNFKFLDSSDNNFLIRCNKNNKT